MAKLIERSESWRSSDSTKSVVDLWGKHPRKYWSIKRCSLTVKCRSTTGEKADNKNFRNEVRYFLYTMDPELMDIMDEMKEEDNAYLWEYTKKHGGMEWWTIKGILEALEIDHSISIQVREYEKELFQLKCLGLRQKPQIILRALLRLSLEKKREEVFTSPELLANLLLIREMPPVFRKDVKFVY